MSLRGIPSQNCSLLINYSALISPTEKYESDTNVTLNKQQWKYGTFYLAFKYYSTFDWNVKYY